jgi:hypothetical protein
VPVDGWEEIDQEPTEHDIPTMLQTKDNILLLFECCSFGILSRKFENEIFTRRGECSDPNN